MRSILSVLTPRFAPTTLLAMGALLAPLALAAPPAAADRCDVRSGGDIVIRTSRSDDRGLDRRFSRSYDRAFDRGSRRSYGRTYTRGSDATYGRSHGRSYGRTYGRSTTDRGHARGYDTTPSGFYKQVYRPAVYRTTYDDCGRARRVCVRAAHYKRVWVSTGPSHSRSRW